MRNPRLLIVAIAAGIVILGVAAALSILAYTGSDKARTSLLSAYFRALTNKDSGGLSELGGPTYTSELGIDYLERGSYELYEVGETSEGLVRFILVAPNQAGEKRAIVGELLYKRHGLANRVEEVRRLEEGRRVD